jgi:IS5 family transposase
MARRVAHMMCAIRTSLETTAGGGFAVGAMALPGNPFDGHTLGEQLEQVGRLTGVMPKRCYLDRGYKEHSVESETCRVIIAGSKKGISKAIKKEMKRRSGIEAEIGHQKSDGKLGRNWLKGMLGNAQNAVLCAARNGPRKILAHLRCLIVLVWAWLVVALRQQPRALASIGSAA